MHFYFEGALRHSYGWETPNDAGIVLGCAATWLFGVSLTDIQKGGRTALAISEAVALVAIALTYSRGALVGLCVGYLVVLGVYGIIGNADRRLMLRRVGLRATVLLVTCTIVGVNRRFGDIANGDPSVVHRLELWRGGLVLASVRPLSGWGFGESGLSYMRWCQDASRTETHYGLVSSYLQLACERGYAAVTGYLFLALFPLIVSMFAIRKLRTVSRTFGIMSGCCGSVACFNVGSVFSTFWHKPEVVFLPALSGAWACFSAVGVLGLPRLLRLGGTSLIVAATASISAYCCGVWTNRTAGWRLFTSHGNMVTLRRNPAVRESPCVEVILDASGDDPRVVRAIRLAVQQTFPSTNEIDFRRVTGPETFKQSLTVLVGARAQLANMAPPTARIIILFPTGMVDPGPIIQSHCIILMPASFDIPMDYSWLMRQRAERVLVGQGTVTQSILNVFEISKQIDGDSS